MSSVTTSDLINSGNNLACSLENIMDKYFYVLDAEYISKLKYLVNKWDHTVDSFES